MFYKRNAEPKFPLFDVSALCRFQTMNLTAALLIKTFSVLNHTDLIFDLGCKERQKEEYQMFFFHDC